MWPFTKKSARRKEIRRGKAQRGLTWYPRLFGRLPLLPGAMVTVAAVTAALIISLGGDSLAIRVGQTAARGITSRVEFRIEDTEATNKQRDLAWKSADVYYELDASLLQDIRSRLANALHLAKEHVTAADQLEPAALKAGIRFDEEGLKEILRIAASTDAEELNRFQRAVENTVERLVRRPLVEAIDPALGRTPFYAILIDRREPAEESDGSEPRDRKVPYATLLTANVPEAPETVAEAAARAFNLPLRTTVKNVILQALRDDAGGLRSVCRYLPEQSDQTAEAAHDSVPTQFQEYPAQCQLADSGEITADELFLLRHEHAAFRDWVSSGGETPSDDEQPQEDADPATLQRQQEQQQTAQREAAEARFARRLSAAGYAFLAILITLGLRFHIARNHSRLRVDSLRQLLVAAALLVLLGAARVSFVATSATHYAVGMQAFAAILLVIVVAKGPVSAICGALALLVTLATRQGVGFLLVLLPVSMTVVLGLQSIRSRGKIVAVGAAAGLVALIATVATGLIEGQTLAFVFWQQALPAGATTLAAAFIVEGTLPAIERVFKVSTDMTLFEWGDASKPLLRMLAAEAPGTYNHSLLVGTLGEAAADAIGANGLLVRTGAYFHDIGKISKPEYFAENKSLGINRHERLSPAMSHLIIIGHVKDGIEMAREYGVPASLHPFIPEHHGTTLVQYFFHAASMQRKPGDREVSDVEFRYPGPKPQSRETAILMLCDGVEGAVRAMPEPTPNRIEDTVTKLARQRMMDGQFDECDLTFRDLEIIERSLVKSLSALYHSRIAYPGDDDEKKTVESRAS